MRWQNWKEMPRPLKSWQFYHACRKALGDAELMNLFKRSYRTLCAWSTDPDTSEDSRRNPMDRYEYLLERLMLLGHEDIARAAVARQARKVGCFLACESDVLPDKSDWKDELLDDFPPFSDFQQACRDHIDGKVPAELVQHAADELVREIKETVVSVLLHGR